MRKVLDEKFKVRVNLIFLTHDFRFLNLYLFNPPVDLQTNSTDDCPLNYNKPGDGPVNVFSA